MSPETGNVPLMSRNAGNESELIDWKELAARWRVPESWIRNRTRARTPKSERIPCIRLGRFVRFERGSTRLAEYVEAHAEGGRR